MPVSENYCIVGHQVLRGVMGTVLDRIVGDRLYSVHYSEADSSIIFL